MKTPTLMRDTVTVTLAMIKHKRTLRKMRMDLMTKEENSEELNMKESIESLKKYNLLKKTSLMKK